ncbi:hypothetical protein BD309DRAFT_769741 [Dichomitus squalens]|nr:hypothetical protein BD309DRAFT_769741 [Dichomitus squalens]
MGCPTYATQTDRGCATRSKMQTAQTWNKGPGTADTALVARCCDFGTRTVADLETVMSIGIACPDGRSRQDQTHQNVAACVRRRSQLIEQTACLRWAAGETR